MGVLAPDGVPSLGARVEQAESELLYAREEAVHALHEALGAARDRPAVVYLHGPAGVGKSALLKAFCRTAVAGGATALLVDGGTVGSFPGAVLRELHRRLPPAAELQGSPPTPETIAGAINDWGGRTGFVLCIDHYDELVTSDAWLRKEILYRFGPGVCTVLADRRPPDEAWPGERAWRAVLRLIHLDPFTTEQADGYLEQCGVPERARPEALRLAGNSPALLGVVADGVAQLAVRSPWPAAQVVQHDAAHDQSRSSALLEQIVHPGSRRLTWRAGLGASDVDKLLAAASVLKAFDREVLAAMIGTQPVESGWSAFTRLRVVFSHDGRHVLHDSMRETTARIVHSQRPWAARQWERRALDHLLDRLGNYGVASGQGFAWNEATRLALRANGGFGQTACVPGVAMHHGAESAADVGEVPSRLRAAARNCPPALRLLRDAGGRIIAGALLLNALTAWTDPTGQLPDPAAIDRWVGERGRRALVVCGLYAAPGVPGAWAALLSALCLEFGAVERVVAVAADSEAQSLLRALHFHEEPALGLSPSVLALDLGVAGGAVGWLRQVARGPVEQLVAPARRRDAARDALLALNAEDRLPLTEAARHYAAIHGQASLGSVRTWILDALATADLGHLPVPGRDLLTRYYVQRAGSHEAIAEQLNLTRATYFRWHRLTLDRFAESLFS